VGRSADVHPEGELSIDNNVSEGILRAQTIGRKKCMFVGTDRGGRTAPTLYSWWPAASVSSSIRSLTQKDILERLPTRPTDLLGELLPDAWITANPSARRRVAW
jgi:transposase